MNKNRIAAQLYCFRDYIKTLEGLDETFQRLHDIGYESVQLTSALPPDLSPEQILELLKRHELKAISAHESSDKILEQTDETIQRMQAFGLTHLAYPNPTSTPTGIAEVVALAHKLNDAALKFRAHGITLAYHNHAIEFVRFQGKLMLELIYEHAPDLAAELDTHWVQRGGGNPLRWIKRMTGRMDCLHIKDYGMARETTDNLWSAHPVMTPIGSGNLDWDELLPAAEKAGVRYFIVEHDCDCPDPFASFASSLDYLSRYFTEA